MGIAFEYVRKMDELGLLRQGMSILDVGSSNLYSASQSEIADFVRKYASSVGSEIEEFSERLARGSAYDPVKGGLNESFIGELFEKAGMNYVSIDIAHGYKTTILDLNRAELPSELRGAFDLVLNFGTTEHVLNQWNSFKIIHEAAKVGGHIYHSLPAIGYVNHGYITYTGRCFFDLAANNGYEIIACWFNGPDGRNRVTESLEAYGAYFPALKASLEELAVTEQGRVLRELAIPDIGINVVLRKTQNKPFFGALDSSTSVGAIPHEVTAGYGIGVAAATAMRFRGRIASALDRYPLLYGLARRIYRAITSKK